MIAKIAMAVGLLVVSDAAHAQSSPPDGSSAMEAMLARTSTYKIKGACTRLVTPEGDQTATCDKELINVAFPSGNSSFIATTPKGGVSFRGRDSAAKGDVATIRLTSVTLTTDLSTPPVDITAKGQCTYTNPNKGPIHVDCLADTARGKYELSFVSDGVWPPR